MKIKPENVKVMYDSILVMVKKPVKEQKQDDFIKSESGIYVPAVKKDPVATDQSNPFVMGKVVAVGGGYISQNDNKELIALSVIPGDYVVYDRRNNANNLTFEAEDELYEYKLLREQNILMIVTNMNDEDFNGGNDENNQN